VLRKHQYEGFGECPGSGYDIKAPAAEQDKLLAERVRALLEGETKMNDYEMLVQRIRVGHPEDTAAEMIRLLDSVVADTRRDQARVDAELMQKNADRAPKAPAPKGGTTSRAVFTEAARMLHPDVLGWSLELPEHLREGEK
jgi:hypothetical protein